MQQSLTDPVGRSAGAAQPLSAPSAFLQRDRIRPGADYVAPANETERRLAAIWQAVMQIDRVGTADDFFALGGDSMQAAALFQRLEAEFGVKLPPSTILEHPTVSRLAALVAGDRHAAGDGSLVVLQKDGRDPPLFFFHAAGGNVICYRQLVRDLGPGRRMFAFAYPDQNLVPVPRLTVPEMAARYIGGIKRIQPAGPYLLIGYSFGGNIAYEVARQLREAGNGVGILVMIDSITPQPLTKGLQRVARKLSLHLGALSNEPVSRWGAYFWRCLRNEFDRDRKAKKAELRSLAGLAPDGLNPRQAVVDALDAAHASYFPPPYDGPIKLFRCTQTVRWALTHLGWGYRARGGIELSDLPTHHYGPMEEPIVSLVAAQLRRWLSEAGL